MTRSHPLFYVDNFEDAPCLFGDLVGDFLVWLGLVCAFEVGAEVLEKSDLLLQLFRVIDESVFLAYVLAVGAAALHVVEVEAVRVQNDLGRVVEEDSSRVVTQVITETILRGVVYPFFDPDFVALVY
jgi:hypothetical protein